MARIKRSVKVGTIRVCRSLLYEFRGELYSVQEMDIGYINAVN